MRSNNMIDLARDEAISLKP
jgi:hypothetical protein